MARLRLSGGLLRCGRCGKRYTLTHTCVIRMDRKTPVRRTRVRPKLSASLKCPRCGRGYANPLTHTCPSRRGDFKRRAAAAEKRRKAEAAKAKREAAAARRKKAAAERRARPQHDYHSCNDGNCRRVACEAWREALEEGRREGYEDGRRDGYKLGERDGYDEGLAACARTHKN